MIVIVASEAIDFILPILEYVYRHTKIYCAITGCSGAARFFAVPCSSKVM
jgi:hypothetical protein